MPQHEVATLAGGCFWCLEAAFAQLKGVERVESGYSGGHVPSPSYEDVCTGSTGHAEVVQITFDPQILPFRDLLHVFFTIHDPTTPDRQGGDVGTQYRSAIFYHTAEEYHRDYYRRNPNQGYCRAVIAPKVAKVRKLYLDKLKQPVA